MGYSESGTLTLKVLAQDLASGKLGAFTTHLDAMAKKGGLVGSVLQGVGQSFGQMLNPVALVSRGIGMVTDILGDATRAAVEEEASIRLMTTAIEENDAAWNGNVDTIEAVISAREGLAFADDEQRDSLRVLVSVTQDYQKALDLQRVAMDLARLKNMSLASAGELLGKVYAGNIGILGRHGIVLAKGTTATEAIAEVQRRAANQAQAYANTTQGKLVTAQIALDDAMEDLGTTMVPIVTGFAELAIDVLPKVADAFAEIGKHVQNLMVLGQLASPEGWGTFREEARAVATEVGMTAEEVDGLIVGLADLDASMFATHTTEERMVILQQRLNELVAAYKPALIDAAGATYYLNLRTVDMSAAVEGATGSFKKERQEIRGLVKDARDLGDERDKTGKRLRDLTKLEKELIADQVRAAEQGKSKQVAAFQRAIDKVRTEKAELEAMQDLAHNLAAIKPIVIDVKTKVEGYFAGLFPNLPRGGGGGSGGGKRRGPAHGGTISEGDWGTVGEEGPERFHFTGGRVHISPLAPSRGGSPSIVVTGNTFLGDPSSANQWARAAAPALVREMRRLGVA